MNLRKRTVVAKFGGTSVQDTEAIKRCVQIIGERPEISLVVVSATANTTNQLEELAKISTRKELEKANELIRHIEQRHLSIAKSFDADENVEKKILGLCTELKNLSLGVSLLGECSPRTMDQFVSTGEQLSAPLFHAACKKLLKTERPILLENAWDVIQTDDQFTQAKANIDLLKQNYSSLWLNKVHEGALIITQGYIAKALDGAVTTLGREGSDLTATLLAEAMDANEVLIWKDVSGIATTDPRIIQNVRFIPELSYSEMSELSTLGAKVLHPMTLRPAIRSKIPVYIGNSLAPEDKGTWILPEGRHRPLVQAMALREEQSLVTFRSTTDLNSNQFFREIFQILCAHNIPLDLVNTHENSMTFLMPPRVELNEEVKCELQEFCEMIQEDSLALVSLIGHGMNQERGLMTRLFAFLENFRVRQIHFGTGKHGLSLLVDQKKARALLSLLHHYFIESNEQYESLAEAAK